MLNILKGSGDLARKYSETLLPFSCFSVALLRTKLVIHPVGDYPGPIQTHVSFQGWNYIPAKQAQVCHFWGSFTLQDYFVLPGHNAQVA